MSVSENVKYLGLERLKEIRQNQCRNKDCTVDYSEEAIALEIALKMNLHAEKAEELADLEERERAEFYNYTV